LLKLQYIIFTLVFEDILDKDNSVEEDFATLLKELLETLEKPVVEDTSDEDKIADAIMF